MNAAALVGDPYDSGISKVITNEYIEEIIDIHGGITDVRTKYSGGNFDGWMRDQINDGVSFLNYRGFYGFSNFNHSDVDQLNNGFKLPFLMTLTCGVGSFHDDTECITEALFRAGTSVNPKGAVAVVGTAQSYTHTAFNNIVTMGMYEGIFINGATTTGEALQYGHLVLHEIYPQNPNNNAYYFSAWNNLMGDPALHLWTDTPKDFVIDGLPSEIALGTNYLDLVIRNSHGLVVEDARVTLLLGDDLIFESKYTNPTGQVSFNWDNISPGELYVTVTKRNYRPLENSVQITSNFALSAFLDTYPDSNFWKPGQTVNLQIPISNIGEEDILGLQGALTSSSNLVNIISSESNYPDLLADTDHDTYYENDSFYLIEISEDAIYGDDLNLILELSDQDSNHWEFYVLLDINSPKIDILDFLLDSMPEPGESVDAFLQVQNNGNLVANGVSAEVISSSNLISINNAEIEKKARKALLKKIVVEEYEKLIKWNSFHFSDTKQELSSNNLFPQAFNQHQKEKLIAKLQERITDRIEKELV